jgi:hypothetical protein
MKGGFYEELECVFDKFSKYHMKLLLGHFSTEDILKRNIGNESLHKIGNYNAVRVVNFATSKNLTLKSTMFPHRNFNQFTCIIPDGKTNNQIIL